MQYLYSQCLFVSAKNVERLHRRHCSLEKFKSKCSFSAKWGNGWIIFDRVSASAPLSVPRRTSFFIVSEKGLLVTFPGYVCSSVLCFHLVSFGFGWVFFFRLGSLIFKKCIHLLKNGVNRCVILTQCSQAANAKKPSNSLQILVPATAVPHASKKERPAFKQLKFSFTDKR